MNIVITVEEFDPNKGYLEYYLSKELAKLGHRAFVFTFGWSKKIQRTNLKEGFEVFRVPYILFKNGYHIPSLNGIIYIIKFIKMLKPDIIHCQPLFSPLSLFFISLSPLFHYKIVGSLTSQEFLINSTIKKLLFYLLKLVTRHYIKNKSELIFVKTYGFLKWLKQMFNIPSQMFRIIPLGADSELFKFNATARRRVRSLLGLSNDDTVIVYSGKIIPIKRLELLITALSPIIKHNKKVKLLIIGKGEKNYIEYLKSLISTLKISENIIFHPWVNRTKLPELYSASDIAVWPGLSSISIVEAASTSLPVIIEKASVEKFALEYGNGFEFERGNVLQLRKYLEILIYNEALRKEMGRKSRNLIERKLNWKTITKTYENAYFHALHKKTIEGEVG